MDPKGLEAPRRGYIVVRTRETGTRGNIVVVMSSNTTNWPGTKPSSVF